MSETEGCISGKEPFNSPGLLRNYQEANAIEASQDNGPFLLHLQHS